MTHEEINEIVKEIINILAKHSLCVHEANIVLATTKNRSHRIAIGRNLYAEVTLIYQNHGYKALPWTYADYRSDEVQRILLGFRNEYLHLRKLT